MDLRAEIQILILQMPLIIIPGPKIRDIPNRPKNRAIIILQIGAAICINIGKIVIITNVNNIFLYFFIQHIRCFISYQLLVCFSIEEFF